MTTADRTIQGSSASSIGISTYASSPATLLPTTTPRQPGRSANDSAATGGSVLERDTGKGVHACEEIQPLTNIRGFIAITFHGLREPSDSPDMFVVKATRMKHTLTLVTLLSLGVTVAEAQTLEKSNPPALSKPAPGTYTHVVKAGKLLFIAGQTGVDAAGKVASPGMKEQLEQVMINLLAALKSQGADFSHVAKTTTFVTSISEFRSPEVAAVRAKYLGANPPANTLVQIQQLADPAYKVEIEAIAVLP